MTEPDHVRGDLAEVRAELNEHWHSTKIWSLGHCHHADELPGFVAEVGGRFAGLVTISANRGDWQCEVITLSSRSPGNGVGAALLRAAEEFASSRGCRRIYLTDRLTSAYEILQTDSTVIEQQLQRLLRFLRQGPQPPGSASV